MTSARSLLRRPARSDVDTSRAQRVTRILELVERFVYDLGLLISGETVELGGYVEARAAERLHQALRPALDAGSTVSPDFGEYAQVRIEGDLLDRSRPVWTVVEFDDRSLRVDDDGFASARPRRRVRLQLLLDDSASRVLDHRIALVS